MNKKANCWTERLQSGTVPLTRQLARQAYPIGHRLDGLFYQAKDMPLLSVSKAAKLFDVSRPTLQKALKDGAITGKKVMAGGSESWQIDTAELSRLYGLRDPLPANIPRQDQSGEQHLFTQKFGENEGLAGEAFKKLQSELQAARAELEMLRAGKADAERELAASQAVADERRRILDDMGEERRQLVDALKRLPKPEDRAQRQSLWAWLTGK